MATKKVKIYRQRWSCMDCRESIEYYPDIKVIVDVEGRRGENHFCSNKCLRNYVNHLSIVDEENPKDLYRVYNYDREVPHVRKVTKSK